MRRPGCSLGAWSSWYLQDVSLHPKSWTSLSASFIRFFFFLVSERSGRRKPPAERSALYIFHYTHLLEGTLCHEAESPRSEAPSAGSRDAPGTVPAPPSKSPAHGSPEAPAEASDAAIRKFNHEGIASWPHSMAGEPSLKGSDSARER